jgi:DNA-binding response OmpR family regulator
MVERENAVRLLIVDADRDWIEMLTGWLKTVGFEVYRAYTGKQARDEWEKQQPDFVILDTSLKDADALAMCRDMQKKHDALVLAMSEETDVQHEIFCLESGADDYLHKPFLPRLLLARIHAMSRRSGAVLGKRANSMLTVGPITMDTLRNEVHIAGKMEHLTPIESKLLHFLVLNANSICTVHQIVSHIWGLGCRDDINLIKSHIRHLRQKIEPEPEKPEYILTVPGVGYTLVCRPDKKLEAHMCSSPREVDLPWHIASVS